MNNKNDILLPREFDRAFIGGLRIAGQSSPIAAYDFKRCVNILISKKMDEDQALEWIERKMFSTQENSRLPALVMRCSIDQFVSDSEMSDDRDYGDEHIPSTMSEDSEIEDFKDLTVEEEKLVQDALQNFALNFIRYVKEVDNSLYNRANEYAADYSGNSIVEFSVNKKKEDEDANGS